MEQYFGPRTWQRPLQEAFSPLTSPFSGAGPNPQVSKGTHILVPVGSSLPGLGWSAEVTDTGTNTMSLRVSSSPSALIGKYQFSVKTRSKAGEYQAPFDPRYEIYLLFNPWCSGESGSGEGVCVP